MSRTITFPSGNTAVLKEADDLTMGDREDLLDKVDLDDDVSKIKKAIAYNHAMAELVVESWTFTDKATGELLPLPSQDNTSLRRLVLRDGAYLQSQTDPLVKDMFPSFDVEPEGSPTGPSAA